MTNPITPLATGPDKEKARLLITLASVDKPILEAWKVRLEARIPELDETQARELAMAAVRCEVIKGAVADRSLGKKHAGRKPNYAIAVLLADIVASGVAEPSDLNRLASGSYWEGRPRLADAQNSKVNRLEKLTRAVLGEVDIVAASLQAQARIAKKFLLQIQNIG